MYHGMDDGVDGVSLDGGGLSDGGMNICVCVMLCMMI